MYVLLERCFSIQFYHICANWRTLRYTFYCLPLSFYHRNISVSVMFFLKFLDICFRLLLYESIFIPKSFQIPPPPFLKGGGGITNKYTFLGRFYPLTSTKTHKNNLDN